MNLAPKRRYMMLTIFGGALAIVLIVLFQWHRVTEAQIARLKYELLEAKVIIREFNIGLRVADRPKPRTPKYLKEREAQLEAKLSEIRWLYQDDLALIAALEVSQRKWEEYCIASLEARFPGENKQRQYGSDYEIGCAVIKSGMIETRLIEVSAWTEGTAEGDASKGSVKLKSEIDALRKKG